MSLEDFLTVYEQAGKSRDIEAVLRLIDDDAVYLFSNQSTHIGKAAIRKALQTNRDTIKGDTYHTHHVSWLVKTDDVAVCIYEFDWTGEVDGKPASGSGRGTNVIRRFGGEWRIIHEHLSRGRLRD